MQHLIEMCLTKGIHNEFIHSQWKHKSGFKSREKITRRIERTPPFCKCYLDVQVKPENGKIHEENNLLLFIVMLFWQCTRCRKMQKFDSSVPCSPACLITPSYLSPAAHGVLPWRQSNPQRADHSVSPEPFSPSHNAASQLQIFTSAPRDIVADSTWTHTLTQVIKVSPHRFDCCWLSWLFHIYICMV